MHLRQTRGKQAGRCKTGGGRLRLKRGKGHTRRRSRCGAAAELTRVVCGHILPFGGRWGELLVGPFGSRLGAVGAGRFGRFGGVRELSGAFGGGRGRGCWPVGGSRGRCGRRQTSGMSGGGSRGQSGAVGWAVGPFGRAETPRAGLGGAKVAACSVSREDGR